MSIDALKQATGLATRSDTNDSAVQLSGSAIGLSVSRVRDNREAILALLKHAMREGINADYAIVPGTNGKPSLLKPGAEKICSMFGMAVDPSVEDLSTSDAVKYRVTARLTTIASGAFLGSGVGEASSAEEKYQWRAAVHPDEFENVDPDRRRIKYKADGTHIKQVRENHADKANTVLKMAKKRAMIDAVLTVTAASDMFTQDMTDADGNVTGTKAALPNNQHRQAPAPAQQTHQAPTPASTAQSTSEPKTAPPERFSGATISEAQGKRFYAIYKGSGKQDSEVKAYCVNLYGNADSRFMPVSVYEQAVEWARGN